MHCTLFVVLLIALCTTPIFLSTSAEESIRLHGLSEESDPPSSDVSDDAVKAIPTGSSPSLSPADEDEADSPSMAGGAEDDDHADHHHLHGQPEQIDESEEFEEVVDKGANKDKKDKQKRRGAGAGAGAAPPKDDFPRNPDGSYMMPKMTPKELEELIELAAYLPNVEALDFNPAKKKKPAKHVEHDTTEEEDIAQHLENEQFRCSHCRACVRMTQELFQQKKSEEFIARKLLATCSVDSMENSDRVLCNRMLSKMAEDIVAAVSVGEEPETICEELGVCIDASRVVAQAKLLREEKMRVSKLKAKYQSFMSADEKPKRPKSGALKASKGLKSAKGKAKAKSKLRANKSQQVPQDLPRAVPVEPVQGEEYRGDRGEL